MAYRGLYQLLIDALQERRPGMASDDPAEVAGRYPQGGVPNGSTAEAQTRFPPPVDVPPRNQRIRQLSLAPFATQAQSVNESGASSGVPDYAWAASSQNAGLTGSGGVRSTPPWWAPRAPMVPFRGGKLGSAVSSLGGPFPLPGSSELPDIRMPKITPEWQLRLLLPMLMLHPELQKHVLGETGESEDTNAFANPIQEFYAKRGRGAGRKADRPVRIPKAPSIVPDVADEAPDTSDKDSTRPIQNEVDCEKEEQEAVAFCIKAKKNGWNGHFGASAEEPRENWDFEKCVKGQKSPACGGAPVGEPHKKPKKGK